MDLMLSGKRAIVTGGSRNIGRAIAKALLVEGVSVVIAARDPDTLGESAEGLARETGGTVHGVVVDTRDDASVNALVASTLSLLGGLDILVNAAARPGARPPVAGIAGVESAFALEELNTKVVGYLRTARAAAPHLVANGWGRIINISGLAARQTGSTVGSIRNVAVTALTKNLADELGPKGVNVTVVHPGTTRTDRTPAFIAAHAAQHGVSAEEAERQLYGGTLIGRIVEADEVADLVAFLASPRSIAINGEAIGAGGGIAKAIHY